MDKDKVHGEGNYKASRDYNEATKRFVESGKVDEAAEKARPRTPEEEQELQDAEQIGKRHAKGEDEDEALWDDDSIDGEVELDEDDDERA
jgi:hypothetical protein